MSVCISFIRPPLGAVLLGALLVSGLCQASLARADAASRDAAGVAAERSYQRTVHPYRIPQVRLIDASEREVDFAAAIDGQERTIVGFIFTTCAGVCPVITANMARAVPELDKLGTDYRILLVSLDPEYDTPRKLREYAQRFRTGERITFLTGDSAAIYEILRAFNAVYLGGKKMNHQPVTLIRAGRRAPWVRLDGLIDPRSLAAEVGAAPGPVERDSLSHAAQADAELGRRLYETGIGRDGEPITARDENGIVYAGEQAACLRCHRRSGFGGSEGGYYVPPIAADFLFGPPRNDRNDRFQAAFLEAQSARHWIRARMPRSRPPYTLQTLAQALREGHNPAGTRFDALMPRYDIDDKDMANLAGYLRGLSKDISPGVDGKYLHIATVVGPGVDPGERDAMLRTTRSFVDWYNERLKGDLEHRASMRAYGMQFRSSTRLWKLHVWNLEGPSETWARQLEAHQAEQPVFVIVNGMVEGPWTPVARFCDAQRMPCVLPLTELPDTRHELGGYSVYYTRGLDLEADLLAMYLAGMEERPARLVQIHDSGEYSRRPAQRFAEVAAAQLTGLELSSIQAAGAAGLESALDRLASQPHSDLGLVIWPGAYVDDLPRLLDRDGLRDIRLFTSSHLIKDEARGSSGQAPPALADRLYIAWPYSLPDAYRPDSFRVRGWMRSRGLPVTHEQIQFMSYYSLGILRDALRHMFEHFHRDYLLERIEHEVEGAANPGFFPTLALGPEQRVLSKGGYVLRIAGADNRTLVADTQWMVP